MIYVYKLKNKITSTLYIGVSNDVDRRLKEHSKSPYPIGRAIRKYGMENFDIFKVALNSYEEAFELESFLIGEEEALSDKYYNVTIGGEQRVFPSESNPMKRKDILENHTGCWTTENNPMNDPEIKKKMIASQSCKRVSVKGKVYCGVREAARNIGVSRQCLVHRLKSKNFPDYFYL